MEVGFDVAEQGQVHPVGTCDHADGSFGDAQVIKELMGKRRAQRCEVLDVLV